MAIVIITSPYVFRRRLNTIYNLEIKNMDLKTISGINIKTIKITRINIEPLEKDVEITKSKNLNLFSLNYYFDFGFYLCLIPFKFKPLSKTETLSTHFKYQIYKHKLQKVNFSCIRKAD